MTKTFLATICVLGALLVGACDARAQSGSIAGTVRSASSNTPVEGAIVRVLGTTRTALTDSAGAYAIQSLARGRYEVEVRRVGTTVTRGAVVVPESGTVRLDLVVASAAQELVGIQVVGKPADALARLPGAAAVVTAAQLAAQQPFSANEALRTLPGVHVAEEEGAGLRANIGIRGLDPDRSRTLLVLEDGIPVALAPYGEPEMYYSPPIERMERLELVKGSGSVLFGPQTIGGVLNYVTADAPATPSGYLQAQRGSGESSLLRANYGGTWGATRGVANVFHKRTDDLGGLELEVADFTGKLGLRSGANDFGFKLSIYDESSNATYVGLTDSLFRVAPHRHPAPDDRLRIRRYALAASHERTFGAGTTLRTNAYAYQTSRDWQRQDYTYNASGSGLSFRNSTGNRNRSFEVAGIEPRLRTIWSLGGRASELELGARAHYERARDQFITGSTATSRSGAIRDDEVRTGAAVAAFAQNRLFLSERWHVTPGVRLEHFGFDRNVLRTRVRRATTDGPTRDVEDVDLVARDAVTEVIPGIGTAWSPSTLVTVFAGAHRGFAPPRTKDALIYEDATLPPDAQVPALASLSLDAERSWNYEAGTRLTPLPFLSLELTAFALDFSNQIIEPSLSAGSVAQASLANQGRTRHRGAEAALSLDVGRLAGADYSLVAATNYTFVDAVFAGDRLLLDGAGDTVNIAGNRLPYAPRQKVHASLALDHPRGFGARLDGVYVGDQFADNFETIAGSANGRTGRIPAYRVFDLSAHYRIRGVTLLASVKNLADATFIASRRPEGIKPGAPRMVTVGVRVTR